MLIELKLESNEKMMVNIVLIKGYVKEGIRKVPEYLQLHTEDFNSSNQNFGCILRRNVVSFIVFFFIICIEFIVILLFVMCFYS